MEKIIVAILLCAIIFWAIITTDKKKHLVKEQDSQEEDLNLKKEISKEDILIEIGKDIRFHTESMKKNIQFFAWIIIIGNIVYVSIFFWAFISS